MRTGAYIDVTYTQDATGYYERHYRWVDGGNHITVINASDLMIAASKRKVPMRPGSVFYLGSLRLRIVDVGQEIGVYVSLDGWRARLYSLAYHALDLVNLVYHRLILTAWVWGLADIEPGTVPEWRDLHIVKWVKRVAKWSRHNQ